MCGVFYARYAISELRRRRGRTILTALVLAVGSGFAVTVTSGLAIVVLAAAFLIASLLTLSRVAERARELGTLKALGWPQRLVVRQIAGETLLQGLIGGLIGAATVALTAAVDVGLVVLAVGLAILGGLIAGAAGAGRAARLRPAEALRSVE
jgi:putative ABC transport system permease protein